MTPEIAKEWAESCLTLGWYDRGGWSPTRSLAVQGESGHGTVSYYNAGDLDDETSAHLFHLQTVKPNGLQKVNRKVVMDGMKMSATACLSYGDKQSAQELFESEIKYELSDSDASSHVELMKYVDACKHLGACVEEAP